MNSNKEMWQLAELALQRGEKLKLVKGNIPVTGSITTMEEAVDLISKMNYLKKKDSATYADVYFYIVPERWVAMNQFGIPRDCIDRLYTEDPNIVWVPPPTPDKSE